MQTKIGPAIVMALALLTMRGSAFARPQGLTFEDRVRAQEAIERVRHAHQIDDLRPFGQAVPRGLLEKKVRTYLQQSLALERIWGTPLTEEALRAEAQRMAHASRMPERLRELHSALGGDPILILECLVRPILAERLARARFAQDAALHAAGRRRAEALRLELARRAIDPDGDHSARVVTEYLQVESRPEGPVPDEPPERVRLAPEDFDAIRESLPARLGEVGPLKDETDRFEVPVLLEEEPGRLLIARYIFAKRSWDDWWSEIEGTLDPLDVTAVVESAAPLASPVAGSASGNCEVWDNESLTFDDSPSPRGDHTAVWTGSVVIIWGGRGGAPALDSGALYDPATDTWTTMSRQDAPSPRAGHTAVWTGSRMIVWGGAPGGGLYDPVADTWQPVSTTGAPSTRGSHTAVWTGSRMIVWGGFDGGVFMGDGARYDPSSNTWFPVSSVGAPSAREDHTAVWTGSRMIVWGGWDGASYLGTGGVYDPVSDTWSATTMTSAPTPRAFHTAVWTGDRMVVLGGGLPGYTIGGQYDPARDRWDPSNHTSELWNHTAVWTGSRMLVFGGTNYGSPMLTGGASYDPKHDTFTNLPTAGQPGARYGHIAVWTGTVMLVHGGNASGGATRTYGRYSPSSGTWLPANPPPEPRGRYDHSAVWTGNEMIVWGGKDDGQVLNSGFRYDPALDAFTPTSLTGAPSPIYDHSAVWTGNEMIVWKGQGGRYNPTTDTWAPVSSVGVPPLKFDRSTTWTGSEMIVWGGYTLFACGPGGSYACYNYTNGGGRYNPSTNTWTPTTTTGAPEARHGHAAVWTGSRMLIWGGERCRDFNLGCPGTSDPFSTGGSYDPAADSWTDITPVGAPQGRSGASAAWTGSRMIVWGGIQGDSTYVDGGGSYDPATDFWTPLPTLGAPTLRSDQASAWTGSEWLIWGGRNLGGVLATGARYSPDRWLAMESAGAPEARAQHSAVWTGSSLLMWGGIGLEGTRLRSGGKDIFSTSDTDLDTFSVCTDCDDTHPAIYPGAPQICGDGLNNDCSASGWPSLAGTNEVDDDGDGLSECQQDCDDTRAAVFPGAPQICDGVNDDCANPGWPAPPPNELDQDGDGYIVCQECDDGHASVRPGGVQICDGLNNDCNDPVWPALSGDEADGDGDGFSACAMDCDDTQPGWWRAPGEARELQIAQNTTQLSWSSPELPGSTVVRYDLVRVLDYPYNFEYLGQCRGWTTELTTSDTQYPNVGGIFYYLVVPRNACGIGPAGFSSSGVPERTPFCY